MSDPCDPAGIGDGSALVPYDARREVELYRVRLNPLAISAPASPPAVSAEGHGEAVAPADKATVVVMPSVDVDPFASSG